MQGRGAQPGDSDLAEQHVQREPDGEVQDHADDRGCDGRERGRERPVAAQGLDEGGS
jgi:hypothetical protein